MNLAMSLYRVSRKIPDKIALIEDDKKISYKDLWEIIERLSKAFLKVGLKEEDRVAIILPNCKEFIFSFYALLRINAIGVPLKDNFTCYEIEGIFDNCKPKAIITTSSFVAKAIKGKNRLLNGRIVITIDEDKDKIATVYDKTSPYCKWRDLFSFNQLSKIGDNAKGGINGSSDGQIASINYTYRGYGYPLGAVLSHDIYYNSAIAFKNLLTPLSIKCGLLLLPMAHIFPLVGGVIFPLLMGASVVIMNNFIPSHIFRVVDNLQVDYLLGTPTIYSIFLKNYNNKKYRLNSIKHAISGGSFLPIELHSKVREIMGLYLMQGYGLTECAPVICNALGSIKFYSLGVSWNDNVEIKIVDKNDRQVPTNKTGEILIRGPIIMDRYYGDRESTNQVIKDEWFYTGDYGWMDEEGYLFFKGTNKIVKIGGCAVDLVEVKNTLLSHPLVLQASINVTPDDLWGSLIGAEVCVEGNGSISEREIKTFCSERLAPYKIPRKIIVNNKIENGNRDLLLESCTNFASTG